MLSVALAGILACTEASAAQTTIPVRGDVKAIALAGDAVIVAREPTNRGLALERLVPGAPAQLLLRLPRSNDELDVALAASPRALAFSAQPEGDEGFSSSRVVVGPPAGPLREVASCTAGLLLPPVAVSDARIAWREGGCGEPANAPRGVGPVALVFGGPDPATPLRRVTFAADLLPGSIALDGENGFIGLLRPSFFSLSSEVRRFTAGALAGAVAAEDGRVVAPLGTLSNGDGVFWLGALEQDTQSSSATCGSTLFALAPGSAARRAIALPGCPAGDNFMSTTSRLSGDRIHSLLAQPRSKKSEAPTPIALTSLRSDGSDTRVLARGTFRPPRGIAVSPDGRVAWWQRRCAGGTEIVVDDGAPGASSSIPSCSLRLRSHSARVRGSQITLRLRCPAGCSGQVFGETPLPRFLRSFSFGHGTHSLRLRLTRSERRVSRLRLGFEVLDGPSRSARVRLR